MKSPDVETFLRERDSEYRAGYVATVVGYKRPIRIDYVGVPLDFFEGIEGEGEITGPVDIREEHFQTQATLLAVISNYYPHSGRGFSGIQRLEQTPKDYLVKPTPEVTILQNQAGNSVVTRSIVETGKFHKKLVAKLLSLTEYGPRLLGTVALTGKDMDCYRVPLLR